jgi:2-polyprenyl-3-methyl-5-hydroxy-6-metoxy-1,4-benzoquinol methylase
MKQLSQTNLKKALELGPAEGEMTQFLATDFEHLTIVEGSLELINKIPNRGNIKKLNSLFEEFKPEEVFDSIIMNHILEHANNPVALLSRAKKWLAPNGKIFLGVPNRNSIHRLVAVKMGILENPCQLNSRDIALGHRRVYTTATFRQHLEISGLDVLQIEGVFLNPSQINRFKKTGLKK